MSIRKTSRKRAGSPAPVRKKEGSKATAAAVDPKALWRTLRSDQFDAAAVRAIDDLLMRTAIVGREDWRDAAKGDPAAAMRLVISFMPPSEITLQTDLAMTALTRIAIGGNAPVAAALSLVLRNLPGRSARHRDLSNSWLVRNALNAYRKSHRRPVA